LGRNMELLTGDRCANARLLRANPRDRFWKRTGYLWMLPIRVRYRRGAKTPGPWIPFRPCAGTMANKPEAWRQKPKLAQDVQHLLKSDAAPNKDLFGCHKLSQELKFARWTLMLGLGLVRSYQPSEPWCNGCLIGKKRFVPR